MRKPDNKKPGPKGKGGSFKPKGKSDRPGGSRPDRAYGDQPKKREGGKDSYGGEGFRARKAGGSRFRDSAERKPFRGEERDRESSSGERKSRSSSGDQPGRERKAAGYGVDAYHGRKTGGRSSDSSERKSPRRDDRDRETRSGDRRSKPDYGDKPGRERKGFGSRDERPAKRGEERDGNKPFSAFRKDKSSGRAEKPRSSREDVEERKPFKKGKQEEEGTRRVKYDDFEEGRAFSKRAEKSGKPMKRGAKKAAPARKQDDDGKVRLNKYLSNAGVASRREADTLIQSGVVKVNGVVVDQLGYKINPGDKVTYGDAPVRSERKVYLLLNKPKDYITTTDDPQERKTVMELIAKACKERVYPVGRLDRNTTGLLLFTNDGELATKLMHPKFKIKKVYHVSLNKGLKPDDFRAILDGIELEDGLIQADDLAFVGEGKKEIGIEIHSGRNRIVRRIFEHLGYDVLKLDRVTFAGLTKKDLPRGKYRFLTAKEMAFLQMIG